MTAARSAMKHPRPTLRPLALAVMCALVFPAQAQAPAAVAPPPPTPAAAPNAAAAAPAAPAKFKAPASKAATAAKPAAPADEGVLLNFFNADLEAVVRAIGQFTGRNFVIDPRVKGTLTIITERPVSRQQAYEQLLSSLRLQGFTIVESPERGGISRILPEADAKLQGGKVIGPATAAPRGDQIVTQVFRLQYESATNLVPVLRPLIAPNNTISAYPANNSLVITDYADNLRRLQRIIEAVDSPASADVEIVPLKYGLAVDVATIANRILDESARASGQAVDGGQRVAVLAEPRTNSLIVRAASAARLALARSLIARFDQPSVIPGNINVVYLRNAEATRLAPLLRAVISSDPSFVQQASSGSGLSPGGSIGGASSTAIGSPAPAPAPSSNQGFSGGGQGGSNAGLAGLIQADAATNSLIITAPEPLYRNLRAIIEKLDVRRAQVVVESLIAEVSVDRAAEFGVQWQALGALVEGAGDGTRLIGGTNFGGGGTNIISAARDLSSLGTGLNIGVIRGTVRIGDAVINNLGALARALENNANANILSQPNIQTLDNEEGKFLVGQNVPFVTGSFSNSAGTAGSVNPFQTFERKDVGLQLRVKPQVSEGGSVKLAIYVEVSSVAPGTSGSGIVTNKRSFESQVIVEDGNFVVLSGLIEDRSSQTQNKVPLLGDIPILGGLFRYENRTRQKTNTMVFLRPYVIRDERTQSALATDRYDYMRTQISNAQPSEGLIFNGLNVEPLPPSPVPDPRRGFSRQRPDPTAPNVTVHGTATTSPVDAPAGDASGPALAPRPEPASPTIAPPPPGLPPAPSPAPTSALPPPAAAPFNAFADALLAANAATGERNASLAGLGLAPLERNKVSQASNKVVSEATAGRATPAPEAASTAAPVTLASATERAIQSKSSAATLVAAEVTAATAGSARASTAARTPPANEPTPGLQLVQVAGQFDLGKGREVQRQLKSAGFDAYWESVRTPKGDQIRVRVQVDRATQSVADVLTELKRRGFEPILVNP